MTMHNEMPMQDAAASVETVYMMSTDEPFEGTIDNDKGDTEDWIAIEMEAGTTYTISVSGTLSSAGGGEMDTILKLLDSKGGEVMMNDDTKDSLGSSLEFTAEVSDTYYISVSTYRNNPNLNNSGTYTVEVEGMVVDPAVGTDINGEDRVPDDPATDDANEYVSGNDKLKGTDAGENINGKSGDDTLYGMGGDDTLDGGAGNDLLVGGPGADTLKGGMGQDTISYSASPMGVTINLATGTARGGDADGDTIVDMGEADRIEHVMGTDHDDALTGNSRANSLWGLGGNDELDGGRNADKLFGGDGDDDLDGGAGDDELEGGYGADMLTGGDDDDTASYAGSMMGVTVRLHSGQSMGGDAEGDTWTLSDTPEEYTDNDEEEAEASVYDIENLKGSANADILAGDLRDNVIMGGGGDDRIYGGPNPADADKEGNSGLTNKDELHGQGGNDMLFGGYGVDTLRGGDGDDVLNGGAGADMLYGGAGSDLIYADEHDTMIVGGVAVDDTTTTDVDEGMEMEGDVDTVSFARVEEGVIRTLGLALTDAPTDITIAGIENIIGSQGDDALSGADDVDNVIEGGEGGDTLNGGTHGDGGDTLSYEGSDDWVRITLNASAAATASRGHASGDEATGFENVRGSAFDDDLTGDTGNNKLWGMAGDDTIEGAAGNDTIEGGAGADDLHGGYTPVNDTGGAGTIADDGNRNFEANTLSYASSDAGVTVNLATASVSGGHAAGDTIETYDELAPTDEDDNNEIKVATFAHVTGSDHDDRLTGDKQDNHLAGGGGDDTLRAGVGEDRVIGGPGADVLDGGEDTGEKDNMIPNPDFDSTQAEGTGNLRMIAASIDWAVYKHAEEGVTVDLSTNRGTGGEAMGDTLTNIELIWGSEKGDTFISGPGGDIIEGDGGSDTVSYEASSLGVSVDLSSDAQHTTVPADTTDSDNPIQFPNTDPDPQTADASAASALGGVPRLDAMGDEFTDNVEDEDDNPNANGAAGDRLRSIENLTGSDHDDSLTGDAQNNVIKGMGGDDTLAGGSTTAESGGDDKLYGGDGDDTLSVVSGTNELHGGAGDDEITGGSGDDTINAGAGDDQLNGGAGNDTFVFSPDDGDGDDTITGFTASTDAAGDKIDLSAYDLTAEQLMASIDLFGGNIRIDLTEHGGGKIVLNGVTDIDAVDAATGADDTDGELDMVSIVDDSGNGVFII